MKMLLGLLPCRGSQPKGEKATRSHLVLLAMLAIAAAVGFSTQGFTAPTQHVRSRRVLSNYLDLHGQSEDRMSAMVVHLQQSMRDLSARLDARLASMEEKIHSTENKFDILEQKLSAARSARSGPLESGSANREGDKDQQVNVSEVRSGGGGEVQVSTEATCPSCTLTSITKYHEPYTPPDEPLDHWASLLDTSASAKGPSGPITFNESSRIYVLEALPDRCAGIQHKRYALACAVAEAKFLGRALALHMTTCLSATHTGDTLNQWVPTAAYFDLEQLQERHGITVVYLEDLARAMKNKEEEQRPQSRQAAVDITLHKFDALEPTSRIKSDEANTPVIVRHLPVSSNGFDVCHHDKNKELMPLDPIQVPYNRHLVSIAQAIVDSLGGRENFTSLHVRRGDKAQDTKHWPNLDRDTQPDRLLEKLPKLVPMGSTLYIASNEESPQFFDPLKTAYSVHRLSDFQHLWAPGSSWHQAYQALLNTREPVPDSYMKGVIDDAVVWLSAKKIETFNDLTSDPRNGVNW